jgi:hypothetical protein
MRRGAAAYAAKAAGLAASNNPTAVADAADWQQRDASPAARDVLRRLPAPPGAAARLGALTSDMHESLG